MYKLTNQIIFTKAKEIKELLRMKEEIEVEIASLSDELKVGLIERGVDELVIGEYKIRYKEVVSNRFDTTTFKTKHEEIYKQFVRQITSKRFTIA